MVGSPLAGGLEVDTLDEEFVRSLPFKSDLAHAQHTGCFPKLPFRKSSSVGLHGFHRYLFLSVGAGSSEVTCLPVQQLLSEATSLVTKFKRGSETVCIVQAIVLDRDALDLALPVTPCDLPL